MIKRISFLALVLLFNLALFAQNATEVAYQSAYLMDFNKVLVDGNTYYLGSNPQASYPIVEYNKLVKVRNTGEVISEVNLPSPEEVNTIIDLYKRGNEIWCLNSYWANCDGPFYQWVQLTRFDTSLNIIENKLILHAPMYAFDTYAYSTELVNGNIIVASADTIAAITPNANIDWKIYYEDATGITEGVNGEIIAYSGSGLDILDTLGNFSSHVNLSFTPKIIRPILPSAYYALSNDSVYITDSGFGVLADADISSYVNSPTDIRFANGEIFVSGTKPGTSGSLSTATILRLNGSLAFVNSTDIVGAHINNLTLDGDTIIASGKEVFFHNYGLNYEVYGGFFKAFETNLSTQNYQHDAELAEVIIDSSYVLSLGSPIFMSVDARMKIKNNGQDTIRHVLLSHTNPTLFYTCTFKHDYKHFAVNIPPGGEEIVDYDTIIHKVYANSFGNADLCFVLSNAAPYLDDNHSNNVQCETYLIPVGNEELTSANQASIFPNPTNDIVNITFELDKKTDFSAVIYDVSGRQVAQLGNQTYASGKHQVTWDASVYPSGLYYCHITIGDETVVKKVSVTH